MRFSGAPAKRAAERRRPIDAEPAIRRVQRSDRALRQRGGPASIRSQARPGRPAARQNGRIRGYGLPIVQPQSAVGAEAGPAPPRGDPHSGPGQPPEPRAQQRRGFHRAGKHPAAAADEGRLPEVFAPGDQAIGRKCRDCLRQCAASRVIAAEQPVQSLAMRQVQPATSGHQQLAPDRRHVIQHRHRRAAGGQRLGRHQPGRSAADHDDVHRAACGCGCVGDCGAPGRSASNNVRSSSAACCTLWIICCSSR